MNTVLISKQTIRFSHISKSQKHKKEVFFKFINTDFHAL